MVCLLSTLLWLKNGFAYRCQWCNCSTWQLEDSNYIIKFYGKGKYDGHYMCLDCLKDKYNNDSET